MLPGLLLLVGLAELLFPKRFVDLGTRLTYDAPADFTVRPWVYTAVRIEGLVFLTLALRKSVCCRANGDEKGDSASC